MQKHLPQPPKSAKPPAPLPHNTPSVPLKPSLRSNGDAEDDEYDTSEEDYEYDSRQPQRAPPIPPGEVTALPSNAPNAVPSIPSRINGFCAVSIRALSAIVVARYGRFLFSEPVPIVKRMPALITGHGETVWPTLAHRCLPPLTEKTAFLPPSAILRTV